MSQITELENGNQQDSFAQNNRNGVIFFGSRSCGHCLDIKPYFEQLVSKYPSVKFAHFEVSGKKIDNLRGVPTFVFYKNGKCVGVVVGADRPELVSMLNQISQ